MKATSVAVVSLADNSICIVEVAGKLNSTFCGTLPNKYEIAL